MPNPYSFGEISRPSQAIEHIASRPALKKQMSRVWSRCLSINRKTQPRPDVRRVSEDEFESVLKSGSERRVFVERGYEVVPRITSTHLAKSRGGFREVEQVCLRSTSQSFQIDDQDIDRPYGSSPSVSTTSRLPYYSHPLSESTQRRTNLPRRPSVIQPKLSRGQIAKFRNASGGSQASSGSTVTARGSRQENCRHLSSGISSSEDRRPVYPPTPSREGSIITFGSSSSISTIPAGRNAPESTLQKDRDKQLPLAPLPLEIKPRRHLASSRSTAEVKGRSLTPSSTPQRQDVNIKAEAVSFETSTPKPGNGVRYPFVCPDRLVQRTISPRREVNKEELTPTYMHPRPAPLPPMSPTENDVPPARDLARIMSYQSTSATPHPTPVDPETLERLFDEVLQACRTGDIPFTSPTNSGESFYSNQEDTPFKTPGESSMDSQYSVEAITPKRSRQETSEVWSRRFEFDNNSPVPAFQSPSLQVTSRSRVTPATTIESKRFIPSGRSFEPLRTINLPNTALLTGSSGDKRNKRSVTQGRVKEAIAKFENVAVAGGTPPTTPIRGESHHFK